MEHIHEPSDDSYCTTDDDKRMRKRPQNIFPEIKPYGKEILLRY